MLDLNREAVDVSAETLRREGVDALALGCDVADPQAVMAAIEAVMEHFGGIDVLINNAGISARAAFADTHLSVFHKVMAINFFGRPLRRQGRIGRSPPSQGPDHHHFLPGGLYAPLRPHGLCRQQACPARAV
jgi:NAD(P)-dependent dehydrogenase (short-subunit alcohol dehydrogenase family)